MTDYLLSLSLDALVRLGRHPIILGVQSVTLLGGALLGSLELAGVHVGPPTRAMLAARRAEAQHAQGVADICYLRLEQGDAAGALPICRQAVGLAPDSARAQKNLGLALLRTKKPWEAAAVLEKAVQLSPGMDEAHYLLGRAWRKKGDPDSAKREYERATLANPSHIRAHYCLAREYEASGQPAKAIEEYYAVLRIRPDHRKARTELIPLLRRFDRFNEARELEALTDGQP